MQTGQITLTTKNSNKVILKQNTVPNAAIPKASLLLLVRAEKSIISSITKKNQGGSVVERNPYANYQPKAI